MRGQGNAPLGMGYMDIWDIGRIAVQRWYIVVPTFLLAMVAAMALRANAKTDYSADASILLVAPRGFDQEADAEGLPSPTSPDNPYLSFPSALSTMADATQLSVSSDDSRSEVAAVGLASDYEVFSESRSPLLTVQVASTDAGVTIDTVESVIGMVQSDLDDRQAEVDVTAENRIATEILAVATSPSADSSAGTRTALSVLALGILVALTAAVVFDSKTSVATARPDLETSSGHSEDPDPTGLRRLLRRVGRSSTDGSEDATDTHIPPDSKGSSTVAKTATRPAQEQAQLQQLRRQSPRSAPPAEDEAKSEPRLK